MEGKLEPVHNAIVWQSSSWFKWCFPWVSLVRSNIFNLQWNLFCNTHACCCYSAISDLPSSNMHVCMLRLEEKINVHFRRKEILKKIFWIVWICVSVSEAAVVKWWNYVLSTKRACLVKGLKYKMCWSSVHSPLYKLDTTRDNST